MVNTVRDDIYEELEAASQARQDGNEGMARVCARRAAGWAIGFVHGQYPEEGGPPNAYNILRWYSLKQDAPEELQQAAKRLTTRITPEYTLPHPKDPLEDAMTIVRAMLDRGGQSTEHESPIQDDRSESR